MSPLEDVSQLQVRKKRLPQSFFEPLPPEPTTHHALLQRVGAVASHMLKQWQEHETAQQNTNLVFEQILADFPPLCEAFRHVFLQRDIPSTRVFAEIDADRSVGILNVLWHALSFTTRCNTKPLALHRPGREPVFTGRILALHGDFQELAQQIQDPSFPELLPYEIASLYVPADPFAMAVMKIRHLGDEELYFHQADAARLFLLKTVEMICGGGFFHERDY
jgi:hypothetical protein